jgi:hypothetical protein
MGAARLSECSATAHARRTASGSSPNLHRVTVAVNLKTKNMDDEPSEEPPPRYVLPGEASSRRSIGAVLRSRAATPPLAVVIFFSADIVAVRRLWRSLLPFDISVAGARMTLCSSGAS